MIHENKDRNPDQRCRPLVRKMLFARMIHENKDRNLGVSDVPVGVPKFARMIHENKDRNFPDNQRSGNPTTFARMIHENKDRNSRTKICTPWTMRCSRG